MGSDFDVLPIVGDLWQGFSHSALFLVLKWFLMVYTIVLLIDIVLLVLLRGVAAGLKTQLYGTERSTMSKNTAMKRWTAIRERLESNNPSQYKAAVLEADHMADELLEGSGFGGKNMGERLANIHPGQIGSYAVLKAAHTTRNRIVNEPNFAVTREEAEALLESYRQFFVELELL